MKKISVILAALVLSASISFAQESKSAPANGSTPAKKDVKASKGTDSKGTKAKAADSKQKAAGDKKAAK
jgi:hypothetical protein